MVYFQVLGVDKSASQRDIQKAFHKYVHCAYASIATFSVGVDQLCLILIIVCHDRLSLKYHPDKNKEKRAQEKFAEINNGMYCVLVNSVNMFL